MRDVGNLFDFPINEGYYKPVIINDAFNSNYIEYESKASKDKPLSIKEYFDIIRPYLSDIINNHETQKKWKVHSSNTIIDYKTHGEWKIQLIMTIYFISSKDSNETRTMHTKSDNVEIIMDSETNEIIKEIFESLLK